MLQTMLKQDIHFLVVGTTIRYRKEIRPLFGKFQIDTTVCGMDDRNLFLMHQFRTVSSQDEESRIMAQMIVQGVAVQKGRTVMNPATLFKDVIGFDSNLIDSITLSNMKIASNSESETTVELLDRYSALEGAMKKATAEDDSKYTKR
jgi:hypothetical protein